MPDETLIGSEILEFSEKLFDNFDKSGLKGASYDIHVGSAAQIPPADGSTKYQSIALGKSPFQPIISLPPGSTCIIQSFEKLHMPRNMKGRLSLRAYHAKRLILFAGGVIDPGYNDFLYLPIVNMGDSPIELKYQEALVTAEFIKLSKDAEGYKPGEEPPSIYAPSGVVFDKVALTQKIINQEKSLEELEERFKSSEIMALASQRILDLVIMGAVGGGVIAIVVALLPGLTFPWNVVALASGLALGIVIATILFRIISHRR